MNREKFFIALRQSNDIFKASLTQRQVEGTEAVLDVAENVGQPIHHLSNVLAQIYRETGSGMYPVKETVYFNHKDQNPSDATVIKRLDTAYAKGQLPWVKKPYWRDGAFGRGQIQLTHWHNYDKLGALLGVNLRTHPELALRPDISAAIAVVGMTTGAFTGKKLSDYNFPSALYNKPIDNPRRIVNGEDGSDAEVAKSHMAFYNALVFAEYGIEAIPPVTPVQPPKLRTKAEILSEIRVLLTELENLGE